MENNKRVNNKIQNITTPFQTIRIFDFGYL